MYKDLTVSKDEVVADKPLVMLVGQPNTGKTTLFNALTHSNYSTVNYPGSTVDYSVGFLFDQQKTNIQILDTPGIMSLNPYSPDEEVAVSSLFEHPVYGSPDLVIVTADATQLSRQIYLATQIKESGFRTLFAVTMTDLLDKRNLKLDSGKLSVLLGMPVITADGRKKHGADDLINQIQNYIKEDYSVLMKRPERVSVDDIQKQYKIAEQIEQSVIIPNGKQTLNDLLHVVKPKPDDFTVKTDRFLLHPVFGIFFFVIIMSVLFSSIFWLAQPLMDGVDIAFSYFAEQSSALLGSGWFSDLVSSGIITGVGSVMVFVPQIVILFMFLGVMEDSGYLARGAMLVDRPLSAIGLNGRSFVPLLSGFACAIPGMMAARTIPNRKERFLTIFVMPLMSCSARLPVYAVLLAFLVPVDKPWIGGLAMTGLYFFSIINGAVFAAIINKFMKNEGDTSFILELPTYRMPIFSVVMRNTYQRSVLYLKKAGLTILVISVAIWGLSNFPVSDLPEQNVTAENAEFQQVSHSYAAMLGKWIEPVMQPLGLDWRVGVSLISAFAAREVFVSSLALILNVTGDDTSLENSIVQAMQKAKIESTGEPLFTVATTTGLIIFFLFAMQCLSTIAVSRKETGGWSIPVMQIIVFTGMAYILTFLVVNGLRAVGIN